MVKHNEEDIRWLRTKLAESKDDTERKYILKQLQLLESKTEEDYTNQKLLSE